MSLTQEEIKQAIVEAGSDHGEVFGFPEKADGLHLQQDPEEYSQFVHFMATEVPAAKLALDIGIASGGQTKFLRDYYRVDKTIVVDIGEHPKFRHWDRIKKMVKSEIVLELIEDSHKKSVREAIRGYAGQVDFTFIDGDHSYKGLKQDIDLAKTVTRKGALYVLHDTLAVADCKKVFDELCADPDFELVRNFDRHFGISVWRYLAVRGPKKTWWSRIFG